MSTLYFESNTLQHHGILGQKWGIRRYQNKDGSYTDAGARRRNKDKNVSRSDSDLKKYGSVGKGTKVKNKSIREDRDSLIDKYEKEDPRYKQMNEYERKANKLYDTYEFDGDDGGGGRTKKDEEAGQKYMELWEQHDNLYDEINKSARIKASKALVEKYGSTRINRMKTQDNIITGAAVVATLGYTAALVTHPVITIGATAGAGVVAYEVAKNKESSKKKG